MAYHQYFPIEFIQLQEELSKHEDVMAALSVVEDKSVGGILAALCTIFGIVIDGTFNELELRGIADMLTRELYNKRTGIVITGH